MVCKISITGTPKAVDAGIIPNIGPVTAMLPQLDIVGVGRFALFSYYDKFVLGPVRLPIPPLVLFQTHRFKMRRPLTLNAA